MRVYKIAVLLLMQLSCLYIFAQKDEIKEKGRIIIEGQIPPGMQFDKVSLEFYSMDVINFDQDSVNIVNKDIKGDHFKIVYFIEQPQFVRGPAFSELNMLYRGIEPNDSIHIRYDNSKPIYSGRGAAKFELQDRLWQVRNAANKLIPSKGISTRHGKLLSVNDYFNWNTFLNERMIESLSLLNSYKNKISLYSYNVIKENILNYIEMARADKFDQLAGYFPDDSTKNEFGLTVQNLSAIYDSTMKGSGAKWLQDTSTIVVFPLYLYRIVYIELMKIKYNGVYRPDSLEDHGKRYRTYYNHALKRFKGVVLEEVLSYIFWNDLGGLKKAKFTPEMEALLSDYYARPGAHEYKKVVKDVEVERRRRDAMIDAPDFSLTNMEGKVFNSDILKDKITVLHFWFTGCAGCLQFTPALRLVEDVFKKDTNIVFVSICTDSDSLQWKKSVSEGKFTTGSGINLYTDSKGDYHPVIRSYGITGYPAFFVLNNNKLLKYEKSKIDPRYNNATGLINFIENLLAIKKDGPYVLYTGDSTNAYYLDEKAIKKETLNKSFNNVLQVQTDGKKTFSVTLKKKLNVEPSVFKQVDKMFVLSDIEGKFDALRKLLQAGGIIDEEYNWTFGKGHLVFAGDMFDRGNQVTECLWLLYSLEKKANDAGGYVHFILGNHEVMNLSGNHSYVVDKYKINAERMDKTLLQLYNESSELGLWLRTKNIVEKIGDILFLHGGISSAVNRQVSSVGELNNLVRPYYDFKSSDLKDSVANYLIHSSGSPLWYRGYYYSGVSKASNLQIDSTLSKFDVGQVITGHTIVSDTISVHYNGKVINTDTKHASGKSEGLLIDNGYYYRVSPEERKKLIFKRF